MYFIFDTETTGLQSGYHEILQLSGILTDDNLVEIGRGEFKVAPTYPERMSIEASAVNGIDLRTWKITHESHAEAVYAFHKFIWKHAGKPSDVMMSGYNVSFDIGFYKALLTSVDKRDVFNHKTIDVMSIAIDFVQTNKIVVNNYKLSTLCEKFNITLTNAHNAMRDAEATMGLWNYIRNYNLSMKDGRIRLY
jgi:DNA polymerase III alpha subunit (gram-positive type)